MRPRHPAAVPSERTGPRPVRAVLFDAVGTLIHLREPVGSTYARFARRRGVRVSADALDAAFRVAFRRMPPMAFPGCAAEEVRAAERKWWRDLVGAVFETAGAPGRGADVDAVFDALFAHYATARAWRRAPGAPALLAALRARGLRTGIVSNFDQRLPSLLAALDLAALLDTIVLPADAGAAKPDPRIFALALARLGVAPADAAYVGDDADDDIAGAERTGLRAIDVTALRHLREILALITKVEAALPPLENGD